MWASGPTNTVISFSGGVADCVEKDVRWLSYGDMGPVLGRMIRKSALCRGEYRLGTETIRATVIGAGCHSAQLSGSTVFCQNVPLPVKNLPVFRLEGAFQEESYERVCNLTDPGILNRLGELWLTGESFDPPEGEYELYRIRLYSSEIPGLYVSLNLNVCAYLQSYALEKYRFTGDTLLSVEDAKQILGDLF
jgi:hypothetical protein